MPFFVAAYHIHTQTYMLYCTYIYKTKHMASGSTDPDYTKQMSFNSSHSIFRCLVMNQSVGQGDFMEICCTDTTVKELATKAELISVILPACLLYCWSIHKQTMHYRVWETKLWLPTVRTVPPTVLQLSSTSLFYFRAAQLHCFLFFRQFFVSLPAVRGQNGGSWRERQLINK